MAIQYLHSVAVQTLLLSNEAILDHLSVTITHTKKGGADNTDQQVTQNLTNLGRL